MPCLYNYRYHQSIRFFLRCQTCLSRESVFDEISRVSMQLLFPKI